MGKLVKTDEALALQEAKEMLASDKPMALEKLESSARRLVQLARSQDLTEEQTEMVAYLHIEHRASMHRIETLLKEEHDLKVIENAYEIRMHLEESLAIGVLVEALEFFADSDDIDCFAEMLSNLHQKLYPPDSKYPNYLDTTVRRAMSIAKTHGFQYLGQVLDMFQC